jgi:hypothetical protein
LGAIVFWPIATFNVLADCADAVRGPTAAAAAKAALAASQSRRVIIVLSSPSFFVWSLSTAIAPMNDFRFQSADDAMQQDCHGAQDRSEDAGHVRDCLGRCVHPS